MILLAAVTLAGCVAVEAGRERILGRDFASVWPVLSEAAPLASIAPAPGPGMRRMFRPAELQRIAARFRIEPRETGLCFERPVAPLDAGQLLRSLERALPEARIVLSDYSRVLVPAGELDFRRGDIRQEGDSVLWTGRLRYAGQRSIPVWARVTLRVTASRVVSAVPLAQGIQIRESSLRMELREDCAGNGDYARSIGEIVGRRSRRSIAAGVALRKVWFEPRRTIERGDRIEVEAEAGAAHLTLEAEAEGSGDPGQSIPVRNLSTGRRFRAQVAGQGRAAVKIP